MSSDAEVKVTRGPKEKLPEWIAPLTALICSQRARGRDLFIAEASVGKAETGSIGRLPSSSTVSDAALEHLGVPC